MIKLMMATMTMRIGKMRSNGPHQDFPNIQTKPLPIVLKKPNVPAVLQMCLEKDQKRRNGTSLNA